LTTKLTLTVTLTLTDTVNSVHMIEEQLNTSEADLTAAVYGVVS